MRSVILIIVGSILLNANPLYAGIGVKPTITELLVSPDSVTKGAFTVVNDGSEPIHVRVEPEDWLKVRTGVSGIPIENWLTITPMEFDIEPQGIKEVEYTVTPPPGQKGELVAMVFFAATAFTEGALNITGRFGVSVYAAIKDTVMLECEMTNITVRGDVQKQKGGGIIDRGATFVIEVENKGNVHLRPTGDILITGRDGTKYDVKIERGFPVYPGTKLSYAIPWDNKDIRPGKYEALIRLDYGNIYNIEKIIERRIAFSVNRDRTISF